ncbi:hypothetical protein [Amaricoccus solimangrovi]|uniref:Uncharacterized protein n=1 Tax=Amaricoccus solimangrovi TaxID=2589815 RepID=A0A501WXB3_9RHOB|nr:hypothetical protein [Amaricoccus solimangrovi]TPE53090.1 hypothetical protein FJM51_03440 [Amaricoccus solimangrovi]
MDDTRTKLEVALAKPLPGDDAPIDMDEFDPWEDVIHGIYGGYSSESDAMMIAALKAVRDKTQAEFMDQWGFAGEFALYVLAGHGLTEYGTSPRYAWPSPEIAGLWDQIIAKWEAFSAIRWPA